MEKDLSTVSVATSKTYANSMSRCTNFKVVALFKVSQLFCNTFNFAASNSNENPLNLSSLLGKISVYACLLNLQVLKIFHFKNSHFQRRVVFCLQRKWLFRNQIVLTQVSIPTLSIKSITSDSKDTLNGENYEMGNIFVLFPFVNMIRHAQPFKRLVNYGTKHNIEFYEANVVIYSCKFQFKCS